MKGLYPPVVYILLFSVGLVIFASVYAFSETFFLYRSLELESLQAEKICLFIKNIEGKEGEFQINVRNFRITSEPLRIIGTSVYNCETRLNVFGSCSENCVFVAYETYLTLS